MSRIVMVHGAGNDLWGPASIKSRWFPALADGLAWHGMAVEERDVTVAFYGDVFRPDPQDGYRPPVDPAGAVATVEGLLQRLEPHLDLTELTKMLTESHFDRLLAQAAAYLQEPSLRAAARARVEEAVTADTRVVVAHSLGTVVSYEALCAHPEWPVTDYVTIGCPLAGDIIRDRLDPGPAGGLSPWPGSVARWTNIADPADPAAGTTPCGRFRGDVVEYKVDNGHRVHDPEPYLNNRWTGQAVAAGLAGP
jgi:pimeloyl-ACP methyl ester carboxylesterase